MGSTRLRPWVGCCVVAALFCLASAPRGRAASAPNVPAERKATQSPPPVYPELARQLGVRGVVKIEVVVAANGAIKSTRPLGGHPLLIQAVEQALKQWKFAPGEESKTVLEFRFDGH